MNEDLILSMAKLIFKKDEEEKKLQLDACEELAEQLETYQRMGHDKRLIDEIAEQRLEYILQTKTKEEMQKVMRPDYIHGDDTEYGIKAEQIIFWSEASMKYPFRMKDIEKYFGVIEKLRPYLV